MFLSYLMLLVALCLSAVAAFYSIVGLTAIFAAAVIPITIMGSILEIAKITVTIWLHEYWPLVKRAMKWYLVPAVFVLMVLTSMGIFGFLSKAHLDQSVPAGDITAQVAIYDEKIKSERDTIEAAKTALRQMDAQVDQMLGRTSDDRGAERAVAIRRQQATERKRLQQDIANAQAQITKLNQERAPIASQARKVEAEVGPIKYVAALIYGDNPDSTLLERAVRWVIILIVAVFDPLAIMMLLAATESLKWEREAREKQAAQENENDQPNTDTDNVPDVVPPVDPDPPDTDQPPDSAQIVADEPDSGDHVHVRSEWETDQQPSEHDRLAGIETGETQYVDWYVEPEPVEPPLETVEPPSTETAPPEADTDAEKIAMREWKRAHPESTIKQQRRLYEKGDIDQVPWQQSLELVADNEPITGNVTGFGISFPENPNKGDMFLRVDILPTVLYKYNGKKWIEIDKDLSDSYTYDDAYIDYLINKLESGEYDAELLTYAEREQIARKLEQSQ